MVALSVKPRVMTPQNSVNFPKTHLKTALNSGKQYKKWVLRAVFALRDRFEVGGRLFAVISILKAKVVADVGIRSCAHTKSV